jgi:predicted aspartyl protease
MTIWHYTISVNLAPERLLYTGPLIPGSWSHPPEQGKPGTVSGEILLDTGAFGAMIDLQVAERLGLPVLGMREIHGIHGYGSLHCYQAQLVLPAQDPAGEPCKFVRIIECVGVPSLIEKNKEHGANLIGIVGRSFLQFVHLEIDGVAGKLKVLLSY